MLIIGHRGAAGLAPENTIGSFKAAVEAGVDMLEFDIRLTRDKVPIVIHDSRLIRTHGVAGTISQMSLAEIQLATKESPVPTLTEVLDMFFGKKLLNIELKSRGSAKIVHNIISQRAGKDQNKWDNVLISSFIVSELITMRRLDSLANLALLHDNNPFTFMAYQRFLKLTAVGFHRLHTNRFATDVASKSGLFCYLYTVNLPSSAKHFAQLGFDGLVTDYPDKIASQMKLN